MRRRQWLRMTLSAGLGALAAGCGVPLEVPRAVPPAPTVPAQPTVAPVAAIPSPPPAPAAVPAVAPVALVPYDGLVEHIMFHPLIAYPDRAFHSDQAQGYDEWFITVGEFDRLLPQVYATGYVLVDSHQLFTVQTDASGHSTLARRPLLLPPGKKPLILSIDDMNYYDYMRKDGNVFRLTLDEHGDIATYSVDPAGHIVLSHDNEIVPIVDRFVAEHPDFSFQGAKGLIALTGYQGILGYRTGDTSAPDYAQTRSIALLVVQRLQQTGWTFASHGWGHLNAQTISYNALVHDTGRWRAEVEPLVGSTDVYVYPFGAGVQPADPKFAYLQSQGFRVFYGIGPTPYLRFGRTYMAMDRIQVDGITLETEPKVLAPFFDAQTVLDRAARGK